ncbi:MAG: Npun_R2821/Npun_R2822 family protein [Cyanobacteria bacterium P01_D01_bin.56]
MESFGIYTLANDVIYDQLVALLNSIEANVDPDIPVCIIPFDHCLSRVREEISTRPNVSLLDNPASIDRWEAFARAFAAAHPVAAQQSHPRWYGGKLHRKFAAFDGPFEKFVFFDGDSLAMKPINDVMKRLETHDFVFDDWEHKKVPWHAALDFAVVEDASEFTLEGIRSKLHCSSFFGSKRGLFNPDEIAALQTQLTEEGEAAWVNGQGWWDDAFLFNYMTLKSGRSQFNFAQSANGQERTGNCANSDPFVVKDNVLYNQEGLKPIHRIHYMGYSSADFTRLCQGEDVDICYRDTFLHYRFLKHLDQRPVRLSRPNFVVRTNRFLKRATRKLTTVAKD